MTTLDSTTKQGRRTWDAHFEIFDKFRSLDINV